VFKIADGALEYCREVVSSSDPASSTLRISESKGCCFSYCSLDTTERGEDGDVLIEADELKIYLEPAVLAGFSEATVDYADRLLVISGQGRPVYTAPLVNMRGGKR
jgi:Fe-S cluster assembly iron-binding protein IscA